jgi:hypothetical protein
LPVVDLGNGRVEAGPDDANIIGSAICEVAGTTYHKVLLDLDVAHHYVSSSPSGHGHLYIDVVLNHEKYGELLRVLRDCGIIQKGFEQQLEHDGCTSLRLPGITKEEEVNESGNCPCGWGNQPF